MGQDRSSDGFDASSGTLWDMKHYTEKMAASTNNNQAADYDEILKGGYRSTSGKTITAVNYLFPSLDAAKANKWLATVYGFEPVPAAIPSAQRKHILGAQGNIWGEFIWDGKDVEYFAFPRALALAEVNWSPVGGRGFENFIARLNTQYRLLDRMQVNYRKPDAETTRRTPEAKAESK